MFCSNCGESAAEGTAFCKNCGAPLGAAGPVEAPGSGPSPEEATATPAAGGRGPLIAGIGLALVIVLAAVGVALYLLLRDDGSAGSAGTTVATAAQAGGTTTLPQSRTTLAPSSTTAGTAPSSTTAAPVSSTTVPASTSTTPPTTPSTTPSTSTTIDATQQYLTATDAVALLLAEDDARIPELAKQINATAPKVPRPVYDELQTMIGTLDAAVTELSSLSVPPAFKASHDWLDEAARFMGERIYSTILGVEAMYDTGKTASATKYFRDGQIARDAFRAAFDKFHNTVPID